MSPPILIAIAVVERGETVLVGRRSGTQDLAGLWEFPCGKLEDGETPPQAVLRECREETGLRVEVREPIAVIEHTYPHRTVRLHCFACACDDERLPHPPFVWVPRERLEEYAFPAANGPLLQWLRERP